MAPEKETFTPKQYPEEAKARLQALLEAPETKEAMKELDNLDHSMATTASPTADTLREWARKAIGYGNYLRKKHFKLEAACKNEQSNRCMEIKTECAQKGITFYDSAAKTDASAYVAPLRMTRDIVGSYVVSADNLISVCRLSLYKEQGVEVEI